MTSRYYCNKCGAEVSPNDINCKSCGADLKKVGRAIKVEIVETIRLADKPRLSNEMAKSFSNISGSINTAEAFIKAVPEENLKMMGLDGKELKELLQALNEKVQKFEETAEKQSTVRFDNCTFNAPVNTTKEGNNIVIYSDINESFNRVYQEIETLKDPQVKAKAKEKTKEIQEEVSKEEPNASKVKKALNELRTIAALATISQLAITIGKLFFGVP